MTIVFRKSSGKVKFSIFDYILENMLEKNTPIICLELHLLLQQISYLQSTRIVKSWMGSCCEPAYDLSLPIMTTSPQEFKSPGHLWTDVARGTGGLVGPWAWVTQFSKGQGSAQCVPSPGRPPPRRNVPQSKYAPKVGLS